MHRDDPGSGTRPYACKFWVDLLGLTHEDLALQAQDIIAVGESDGLADLR
jgi:hypothetical protein